MQNRDTEYHPPVFYTPLGQENKTPHICPVCGGRGDMPNCFFGITSDTAGVRQPCRSCGGTGIVWW